MMLIDFGAELLVGRFNQEGSEGARNGTALHKFMPYPARAVPEAVLQCTKDRSGASGIVATNCRRHWTDEYNMVALEGRVLINHTAYHQPTHAVP